MGIVLACFTWTYALGQIPVGWPGDGFGPERARTLVMYAVGLAPMLNAFFIGMRSIMGARLFLAG